jgi:outer membrane protein assembly factor BamB
VKQLILLIVVSLLAACAGESRLQREEPAPLVDFSPERKVKELWTVSAGVGAGKHVLQFAPLLLDNAIYTADREGRVFCISADRGTIAWDVSLGTALTVGAGGGEGRIVVASKAGEVIALDQADGKVLWKSPISGEILAPASVRGGVVVAQTMDGKLYGLSAADGKKLWTYSRSEPTLSLRGTSSPVVIGDYIFTGFASGKLVALRLGDGRLLWEMTVAAPRGRNEIERLVDVDAAVLIVGETLFTASYQGKIVAVDLKSGKTIWSRDTSTYTGVAADRRNVYVSDEHGHVVALDQQNGASVWKQDKLRARVLSRPTVVDGHVAVSDYEGYVHWLSADDGHFVARYRVASDPIQAPPAVAGEILYVANQGGLLAALQLTTP